MGILIGIWWIYLESTTPAEVLDFCVYKFAEDLLQNICIIPIGTFTHICSKMHIINSLFPQNTSKSTEKTNILMSRVDNKVLRDVHNITFTQTVNIILMITKIIIIIM